jgi:hypothetical protein
MKKLLAITTVLLMSLSLAQTTLAQSDENRNKIQMTVSYGGKDIVTDLNSVSTSLSRYDEAPGSSAVKDSIKAKAPGYYSAAFYLTIDAKKVSDELLKVFSKKLSKFDGTITLVDTYGKNPTRTIKFKKGSLYSYSEQMSSASYSDAYGSTAISISCEEVSINGVPIEQ